MRRFTLITLILLFLGLGVVAYLQFQAAQGERRFCGPGIRNCTPTSPLVPPASSP
jgi:hypothetical protein